MRDVIFLNGRMRAGKDHIGRIITQRYGHVRLALADAVKQEVASLRGITVEELEQFKAAYRSDLQNVGNGRRASDPYVWINKWFEQYEKLPKGTKVICTDARYPNETRFALQKLNGVVIKVITRERERLLRLDQRDGWFTDDQLNHPSEQMVDYCDYSFAFSGEIESENMILDQLYTSELLWNRCGCPVIPGARLAACGPRVYIAGPYTNGDRDRNVRAAISMWHNLFDAGYTPFCPHLSQMLHLVRPRNVTDWYAFDNDWITICDALIRLPGESTGSDNEVLLAKGYGIPVAYSVTELFNVCPPGSSRDVA